MSRIAIINSHSHRRCGYSRIPVIGFACLAVVSVSFGQQTFVGVHGQLNVKGNKIVDKSGSPITLHGMSLYCWAPQGTQFFNSNAINHLAQDWKCTVIQNRHLAPGLQE